ncbi:MAG: hypothetical protein Q8O51_00785 [bacterium]|nr:hypothetical protein [bacterium]
MHQTGTVVSSKAIREQSKEEVTHDECEALMEELSTCAFQEILDSSCITHILGRLTGNSHPPEGIKRCILFRIAFQAALNRSACVETGNLLGGWSRIVEHEYARSIDLTPSSIQDAIREGVECRKLCAEEARTEIVRTGNLTSENKFNINVQERIYKHYFG